MNESSHLVSFLDGLKDIFSEDYEVYMILDVLHREMEEYDKYFGLSDIEIGCQKVMGHSCHNSRIGYEEMKQPNIRITTYYFLCTCCQQHWEIDLPLSFVLNKDKDFKAIEKLTHIIKSGRLNGRR